MIEKKTGTARPGIAARRQSAERCEHGFLEKLCAIVDCPHWDRREPLNERELASRKPGPHSANGRSKRILAKLSTEWGAYSYEGPKDERKRDCSRLRRLVESRQLEHRSLPNGSAEYRRLR